MSEEIDCADPQEPQISTVVVEDDSNSLDDFFKKKDKKGKKKKSKKSDKGVMGDEKESSKAKKKEPVETKKDTDTQKESETRATVDQEEWIDYEDESNRDYSDLKIQNFQINDKSLESSADVPEYNEAGELIPPKADTGPWNKMEAASVQEQAPVPEEPKPDVTEPPKKVGAYRPPQARAGGISMAASALPRRSRRQQQAPEINNEMDFPSLAAASQDTVPHEGFEMVKSGMKSTTWKTKQQETQSSQIKLGNQFAALNAGQ